MEKNQQENGNVTLEDLARMMKRGFDETATKADIAELHEEMNQRFDAVDKRFEKLEARVFGIENRMDNLVDRFTVVERRLEDIDKRQKEDIGERLQRLEHVVFDKAS